jgi:hypothetical protein
MKSAAFALPSRASFNPRRVKKLTTAYLDKLIRSGLGQGVLAEYRPWLQITSLPSRGSSRIVPGAKVPRSHHTLSNSEYGYLVLMEFNPDVLDIREQFPLLEYYETYAIAISKNIRPAMYPGSDVPHVYTTDFMLTMKGEDGGTYLYGISLKYKKELEACSKQKRLRILEKLEVEKEYWSRRNVMWDAIFHEELPHLRIRNLIVIRGYAMANPSIVNEKNTDKILHYFSQLAPGAAENISLSVLLHKVSKYLYIAYAEVKCLFFYMVWHHMINIDIDSYLITMSRPVTIFSSSQARTGVSIDDEDSCKYGTDSR